ncbi:hypothetical protein HYALB_00008276 [Hymenoscyphus albidus]|uniref:M6 metalloprotease n=1 Tax=Hymenoscyphus albidus TaxID=595503 RepID=A0A9N9PZ74_9HELO|nr:hypothetical protein HYALB_00008276 [Hymenoscyphus albidus]
MQLLASSKSSWQYLGVLTQLVLAQQVNSAPSPHRREVGGNLIDDDPFEVLDPQNWVDPANMTWADFKAPPGTTWADPSRKGSNRNFNIALVTVDYADKPFTITLPTGSTIFNNPQPSAGNISREAVPGFYRDFLNTPGVLNKGHTLHEYWMSDSQGRFGVDLTAFGAYRLPLASYQYGIDDDFNTGACPVADPPCNFEIRGDALAAWRAEVGDDVADSYELVFILSAGQDESSTWQEFGEMKFQTKEDVPDSFGPPVGSNVSHVNYAKTRYVEWSSFAASSTIWPNAGGGSSTQAESSGMATYAHELSHLLNIGDNYNNPYGVPLRRAYTGPWSMMSRGSFNGPGGPHTRWQIPAQEGGSLGSHHTVRDKAQLGLIGDESILQVSREALPSSGPVTAQITARAVDPGPTSLLGIRVEMDSDNSPTCSINTDVFCDGGGYDAYFLEVIDRMGADSFTPDHGVMISKSKEDRGGMFQWTIDANPQDIELLDFYRPDGTPSYITLGDYRQLADALFHAGTGSGSEFEYVDTANRLHFYIIDIHRDDTGVLSYTTAVRSTTNGTSSHVHGVALLPGLAKEARSATIQNGATCSFQLSNSGTFSPTAMEAGHPGDVSAHLKSDVYRLKAEVEGSGWNVILRNELVAVEFGSSVTVQAAIAAADGASESPMIKLTAISEIDPSVSATTTCLVG